MSRNDNVDDQRESFGAEAEEYEESSTRELLTVCSDMYVLADSTQEGSPQEWKDVDYRQERQGQPV